MTTPIILDVEAQQRESTSEDWPRPTEVPCECGGAAFQCGKGSTSYACIRCAKSKTVWTGFDDPSWF